MTWAQTNKCYLPMIIKDWTNFSEIEAKALSHSKEETIKDESNRKIDFLAQGKLIKKGLDIIRMQILNALIVYDHKVKLWLTTI